MTASTASPFDQRIATLGRDDLMELLNARHAVRRFTDRPIEGDVRAALEAEVAAVNERYGLSVQLCLDNPGAFDGAPAWFRAGMEAARVAPTALNQQRFRFELGADGRTVTALALPALSCGMIDLGIARLHFELGANTVSRAWRWA